MEQKKNNSRIFSNKQKSKCWNKARIIEGRDPKRWRYDAVGNPVLHHLRGCSGPICHEYDHIIPFSKGGKTSSKNCQILQTHVNRFKSNNIISQSELEEESHKEFLSSREMDLIEYLTYGNISTNF
jgi:5-methylcytosine-specific restriction endonuclease McrA